LIVDLARLGDVTLASPVIANLRDNHPDARIAFLVSRGGLTTVENNPKLDNVMLFQKPAGGIFKEWGYINQTARLLREKNFDVAFLLHRSFASALIAWLAKIPIRIGHDTQGRGFFLTKKVPLKMLIHRLDNNLNLLDAAGEKITHRTPEYFPSEKIGESVNKVEEFKRDKTLVVINPNGVWETKRWNTDKFAQLASRITGNPNAVVVVIGAKGDEQRGRVVCGDNNKILNLTGETSVDDLYRICKMSDLVITNDSGPMHIAAAAGSEIIAIFGPTDPNQCGPKSDNPIILAGDVECLGCYKKTCDDFKCMDTLTVDRIYHEAERILKSRNL